MRGCLHAFFSETQRYLSEIVIHKKTYLRLHILYRSNCTLYSIMHDILKSLYCMEFSGRGLIIVADVKGALYVVV